MKSFDLILWTAAGAFAVAFAFSVAAVTEADPSGSTNVAVAVGAAGSLLPFTIVVPVTTWRRLGMVTAFHGSLWAVSLTGADRWLVFGVSTALFVGAAWLVLWPWTRRAQYTKVPTKTFT